jgi:PAS domain S-box-containing protein
MPGNGQDLEWTFTPALNGEFIAGDENGLFDDPWIYKTILENIQDGVCVIGLDFNIKYINRTMTHIFGRGQKAENRKCFEFYHKITEPCINCPTLAAMSTGKHCINIVQYENDKSEKKWQQVFAIPVFNKESEIIYVLEYIRDITLQVSEILSHSSTSIKDSALTLKEFEKLFLKNNYIADGFSGPINQNFEEDQNMRLKKAVEYIIKNYADEITLALTAEAIFVNSYYLSHLFRKKLNTTFSQYLAKIRIEQAKELLKKETSRTVAEIAEKCGIGDPVYFTKQFKKLTGVSPKEYRRTFGPDPAKRGGE